MRLKKLFKQLFKKSDSEKELNLDISYTTQNTTSSMTDINIENIDIAPNIYLACRGAKMCVNKPIGNGSLSDRLNYISKVIGRGHESILEHTNIIFLLKLDKNIPINKDFIELLSSMKYSNYSVKEHKGRLYVLVGASIRALKHMIRETKVQNTFTQVIREVLYSSVEKQFLYSLIEKDYLDKDRCTYFPDGEINTDDTESSCEFIYDPEEKPGTYSDLVYMTDTEEVYEKVKQYGFTMKDVYKVSIISFVMHDISRSCANQIARHRNGISQESQRYVTHDYTKADFVDPIEMNWENRYKDKLDKTAYSKISSMDIFKNYRYLISAAVLKEDARAWLPMNVKTKLIMTFNFTNLAKFFELRLDKAAQLEIRRMAQEMSFHLVDRYMDKHGKENFDKEFKDPKSFIDNFISIALQDENDVIEQENSIDEVISTETETVEMKDLNLKSIDTVKKYMSDAEEAKKLGE